MFPRRTRRSLAGEWDYRPLARTLLTPDGIEEDTSDLPAPGRAPVPSNWHDHGLEDFDGRVAYETTFETDGSSGGRTFLVFEGVDYFARITLDGVELGRHEGCFDAFEFDVTGRLGPGEHRLGVEVDAPREALPDPYPHRKRQIKGIFVQWDPLDRWMATTGGIPGGVYLEERPDPHIRHVRLETLLVPGTEAVPSGGADRGLVDRPTGEQKAWVRMSVEVWTSRPARQTIAASVGGHTSERDVDLAGGTSVHELVVEVPEPRLWWTWDHGEPALTEWTVRVGSDEAAGRTGLREVRLDEDTGIWWLNGRRIFARGSSVIPEKWLSRYDAGKAERDVALIRDANLNVVRVCAHVAPDAFYDRLDEAGILAWQDFPLQWTYASTPELAAEAARQATAMVRRLANHPSVAVWSCHNEPFRANRETIARVVSSAVRAADPSRTVHRASDFSEHAYPGWFSGDPGGYAALPGAPMPTEFGAQALPSAAEVRELVGDVWPPDEDVWRRAGLEHVFWYRVAGLKPTGTLEDLVEASQRYQAELATRAIETYRSVRYEEVGSVIHFLFNDHCPQISWSVLSYDRVPKLAYHALARAMQPVLICASIVRTEIGPEWDSWRAPPYAALRVINDLPEDIVGARYEVRLANAVLEEGTVDVPADGIAWIGSVNVDDWLGWDPPDLEPGEHELVLRLISAEQILSENHYPVRVVEI